MVLVKSRFALLSGLLFALLGTAFCLADAPDLARYKDYPAVVETVARPAPVRVHDSFTRQYRTQLRSAPHTSPNFAGHYVLATWGCGASCVMGAAIDAKTGVVTRLPFTVSDWPLDVQDPLSFKTDSALLIVRGSRNEAGRGTYYYLFTGNTFKLLGTGPIKP